nr:MAG TPA: hypothetical protein [Ackermannviridae sp.]
MSRKSIIFPENKKISVDSHKKLCYSKSVEIRHDKREVTKRL